MSAERLGNIADILSRGSCLTEDPELFFPVGSKDPNIANALKICGGCDVRQLCLDWAMLKPQQDGIWGGTTPEERIRVRREERERSLGFTTTTTTANALGTPKEQF